MHEANSRDGEEVEGEQQAPNLNNRNDLGSEADGPHGGDEALPKVVHARREGGLHLRHVHLAKR